MRPKEVIHRFLASIGRPEATAQYVRLFQAEQRERFAFVMLTEAAFLDIGSVISDLGFLRGLELFPVLCVPSTALATKLEENLPESLPVKRCGLAAATEVANSGALPLLVATAERERRLAVATLESRKVVVLIGTSGLQPRGESVRSLVNLRTDYKELSAAPLPSEQLAVLREVEAVFGDCAHTFTVSITSAHDLLRELFTVKGAGTLIRRGTQVERFSSFGKLDQGRLAQLLHSAFGRAPTRTIFERPPLQVYLAEGYQGAAILDDAGLAPYLSKFAVDIRAQGEGIGGDLWRALCQDHGRFFWRSRPANPIAPWYAAKCDGLVRGSSWTTYWVGLSTSEIPAAVSFAESAPVDFGASR